MTRTAVLLFAFALTGCITVREKSDEMHGSGAAIGFDHRGNVNQIAVQGLAGAGGLYAGFDLVGGTYRRTGELDDAKGGGLDISVRASPLGILAREHQLERYFDFGAEAGAGFSIINARPDITVQGRGWVGAWLEVGLVSTSGGYVALTGNVRMIEAKNPWEDEQSELMVGLAFRKRGPVEQSRWRFRD